MPIPSVIPVTFDSGTASAPQKISWQTFVPTGPYSRAVVIAYGSAGMDPEFKPSIEAHAKQLAAAGILAVIPDFFQLTATPHSSPIEVGLVIPLRHQAWANVLKDAVAAVKKLPGIKPGSVGLLGFSLGGFLALQVRSDVKSLVSYFAPYQFPSNVKTPVILKGIGVSSNKGLSCCLFQGTSDSLVVPWNCDNIAADLKKEGIRELSQTLFADANHGFQGADAGNTEARNNALSMTISFFTRTL
jgi:dienelactone hydrolase